MSPDVTGPGMCVVVTSLVPIVCIFRRPLAYGQGYHMVNSIIWQLVAYDIWYHMGDSSVYIIWWAVSYG